jgi:hypothetical protein
MLLFLWISISCSPTTEDVTDVAVTSLVSRELNIPSDSIGLVISPMLVIDSFLMYKDFKKTPMFAVYNLVQDHLVRSFGFVGQGPGEFDRSTLLLCVPQKPDQIGFSLRDQFRYRSASLQDLIAGNEIYAGSAAKLPSEFQQFAPLPSGMYIGVGTFDGRYALCDSLGRLFPPQLDFPFVEETAKISYGAKAMLFQGKFLVRPDGQRAIMAYSSFPGWEICQIEGQTISRVINKYESIPAFLDESTGNMLSVKLLPENRRGYLAASVNQDMIALLYSGKQSKDEPNGQPLQSNELHLMDWDGKLHAKYKLDRNLSTIALDVHTRILYGFANGEYPKLVAYQIP